MNVPPRLAIVGAPSELAADLVDLLVERGQESDRIRLYGDAETAGEIVEASAGRRRVELATPADLARVDVVLFCGDGGLAGRLAPDVQRAGVVAIDATPFSRADATVPVVVAEVNGARIGPVAPGSVLACPSPAGMALSLVLAPLLRVAGVDRVVVTVLEPASRQAPGAVVALSREAVRMMQGEGIDREDSSERLAFNLRPQPALPGADGWSAGEKNLAREVAAVLGAPRLEIVATIVRAPVFFGEAQVLQVDLGHEIRSEAVEEAIRHAPGLLLAGSVEDRLANRVARPADEGEPVDDLLPGPLDVVGSEWIHVARVRVDPDRPASVALWFAYDDVRRGIAVELATTLELVIGNPG